MNEKYNPLEGWSKEQIKSALKAHTKTDLLKLALQWRTISEMYLEQLKQYNKLYEDGIQRENTEDLGGTEQDQDMGSDS